MKTQLQKLSLKRSQQLGVKGAVEQTLTNFFKDCWTTQTKTATMENLLTFWLNTEPKNSSCSNQCLLTHRKQLLTKGKEKTCLSLAKKNHFKDTCLNLTIKVIQVCCQAK